MLPDNVREKWRGLISRGFGGVQYAYLGENTVIRKPIKVEGAERIHIGADCLIEKSVHLEVLPPSDDSYTPRLRIGDRVQIGPGVKIICQGSIVIEDDVEIEKNCTITDVSETGPVVDSSVQSRLLLGKGATVAPNSVVNEDVPRFSVVGGSPARLISHFNTRNKRKT